MADHMLFQPYPVFSWGAVGGLAIAAVTGIVHVSKQLYRRRKGVARMAKIVSSALEEKSPNEDNDDRGNTVTTAILQYLAAQERRDIAERQAREAREARLIHEENRRWERVEALTLQLKDQAMALQTLLMTVQNAATYNDHAHQHHGHQLEEIKENQVKLSDWLRDDRYRYLPPRAAGT